MHRQKLGSGRAEVKIIFQQREKEFLLQKKDFFDKLENNRDFTGNSLLTKNTITLANGEKKSHKKSLKKSSIMAKVVLKSNLQNLAFKKESAYVTRAVQHGNIDGDSFLEAVNRNSNLDRHIVYSAAEAISKEFKNFLMNGFSVTVPGIGIFSYGIKAKAAATAEEAGAGKVYRRKINYRPTVELKNLAKQVKLTSNVVVATDEEEGEGD